MVDTVTNEELGLILAVTGSNSLKELYASPKSLSLEDDRLFAFHKQFVENPLDVVKSMNDAIRQYVKDTSSDPRDDPVKRHLQSAIRLEITADAEVAGLHRFDQLYEDDGRSTLPDYIMDNFEHFEETDGGMKVFRVSKSAELSHLIYAKGMATLNELEGDSLVSEMLGRIEHYNQVADEKIKEVVSVLRENGETLDPSRKEEQLTRVYGKCIAHRDDIDTNSFLFQIMAQTAGLDTRVVYADTPERSTNLTNEVNLSGIIKRITTPSYKTILESDFEEIDAGSLPDESPVELDIDDLVVEEPVELSNKVFIKAGYGPENVNSTLVSFLNRNREWLYTHAGKRFLIIPHCPDFNVADACTRPETLATVVESIYEVMRPEEVAIATDLRLGGYDPPSLQGRGEEQLGELVDATFEKLRYAQAIDAVVDRLVKRGAEDAIFFHELSLLPSIKVNGMDVMDTSEYVVVLLSHPKIHNKVIYSGAYHSLLNLVSHESRERIMSGNADDLADGLHAIVQVGNPVLHILDASQLMMYHQVHGEVLDAGMAAVSESPLALDQVTLEYLGLPVHKVEYLEQLHIKHNWDDPELVGMHCRLRTAFSDIKSVKGVYPGSNRAGVILSFEIEELAEQNGSYDGALLPLRSQ